MPNSYSGGGVGGAVGRFLGFDPTPGFNISNPLANQKSSAQAPKPVSVNLNKTYSALGTIPTGGSASDPYSSYGGQGAYNSLVSGFNTQHQNVLGSAYDAGTNAGVGYNSSILDLLDAQKQGQSKVNNAAIQNELAKQQGTQGVLAAVGRGIKSGGVMLANKNAGNSSATQGLADAYGQFGREQLSSVGNQYAQGQNAVTQQQSDLDLARAQGVRHLQDNKTQIVNTIVADAQTKLAALDAQIANANLPNRIAIDQEKNSIRADALGKLQAFDQTLNSGLAGITPSSVDQNRIQANQMALAGQAPANAFNFTTQAPAQLQGTGPSPSPLPLFSLPKGKDQAAQPA